MRALVTGGAGFIGSNLVDRLIKRDDQVVVLDDLSTGFSENINPDAQFVQGDVSDIDDVRRAADGCEIAFHLAAHRAVLPSVENPIATDRANVGGTLAVLVAARDAGIRRVVAASSSSVYGGADVLPTPESAPLVPRSPYAVSKLAGEHYCRVFTELFGMEAVALRFFNVYGPRQRPDSQYAAVIPLFIEALAAGRRPTVHGDGRQTRDFTFIGDAVGAVLLAGAARHERCAGRAYNIAGGRAFELLDLLQILGRIQEVDPEPEHVDTRPGDIRYSLAELSAARSDLGYEPTTPFAEGLAATVEWFVDRPTEPTGDGL